MKTALVLGAGGFIGSHLVKQLKSEGYWVRGVDLKLPEFSSSKADEFVIGDLRNPNVVSRAMFAPDQKSLDDKENSFDEVYQLAADMGGAGYLFTGENDANIMHNSALINLNILNEAVKQSIKKIFYSSSACVYGKMFNCVESETYPAHPDSEYGWEKLFSERLYAAYHRNYDLDIRVARFHNVFGPEGTYNNGKEKAPAALCRKVAEALNGSEIEIWGDGTQIRSFLYIDECIKAIRLLMNSNYTEPINIGSSESITINNLANRIIDASGKEIYLKPTEGPVGVEGRTSDNTLIKKVLGWEPIQPLVTGIELTFKWINKQVNK
jgi:nucleoside-diphosphate-sugar epimerase